MAWLFRRRIRILPGVHVNLGKRGISLSLGPRGLKTTFGKKGVRTTVGLPGTGISHTTYRRYSSSSTTSSQFSQPMSTPKNKSRRSTRFFFFLAGSAGVLWLLSLFGGHSPQQNASQKQKVVASKAATPATPTPLAVVPEKPTPSASPIAAATPSAVATATPSVSIAESNTPPDDYVPKQVRLKRAVKLNLYSDDKQHIGVATLKAGDYLPLARIAGEKVEVEFNGTKYPISATETDLLEQMLGTAEQ